MKDTLLEYEMRKFFAVLVLTLIVGLVTAGCKKKPEGSVAFKSPQDGAMIKGPADDKGLVTFKIDMDVKGYELVKAGTMKENAGHHHLVVNGSPIKAGVVVPADKTHIHYGDARTSSDVKLAPGKYSLTLQYADGAHVSYGPSMSSTINVTVEAEKADKK